MSNNPFADNPYQTPQLSAGEDRVSNLGEIQRQDAEKLKKFRQQIHALGGLWIILSVLVLGLAALIGMGNLNGVAPQPVLMVILLVSGVVHLTIGVLTCMKQMWAVYVGLVLSYLSVIGNVINLNLCALVILAVVILQAHRVIGWAKELRSRGIPLTAKA